MISKFKKSLPIQIIFYINNIALILLMTHFDLEGFMALWFFSPFLLYMFSLTFYTEIRMTSLHKIKKLIKLEFSMRTAILFINLVILSFHNTGTPSFFINLIVTLMAFFLLFKLNNMINSNQSAIREAYSNHAHNFSEKVPNHKQATTLMALIGYLNTIIILLPAISIVLFRVLGKDHRWIVFLMALILLTIYFYLNEKKFYLYNAHYKFRDNIMLFIGIAIILIFQGHIHIDTDTFNFLAVFVGAIFCLPTFITNQSIIDELKQFHSSDL